MTEKIWKYTLSSHGPKVIESKEGARVLSAMFDANGVLSVWMAVDETEPKKTFTFYVVFTGEEVPENAVFVSTEVWAQRGLVFHVFLVN